MKRVVLAVALTAAGSLGLQPQARPPVTIYVAVERPAPMSTLPADVGHPREITTQVVAPWRLQTGLGREDFEVLSDSAPVSIEACVPATGPVSIALVVDVSASVEMFARSAWLRDTVRGPVARTVGRGDRVAIGRVGGAGLRFSPGFSGDAGDFSSVARDILKPTEKDLGRPFGLGGSPIWDGVDRAVEMLERVPGRRAVILLSDGRATANVRSFADVAMRALASGVSVTVVSSALDQTIEQTAATAVRIRSRVLLERLASDTGGAYIQAFGPFPNPWLRNEDAVNRWLECTLARAVEEVRGGYALTLSSPIADGRMHALEVRTKREGLKVRAAFGYRAPQPPR